MNEHTARKKLNELAKKSNFDKIVEHINFMSAQNYIIDFSTTLNTTIRYKQNDNCIKFFEAYKSEFNKNDLFNAKSWVNSSHRNK